MNHTSLFFFLLFGFVATQRLVELGIARRNTKILLARGGVEFGKKHYWVLVLLHTTFFISLLFEAVLRIPHLPSYWLPLFLLLLLAQAARVWVIYTMHGRWTTRIVVLPSERLVNTGPFRLIAHPNYCIVALELLLIPWLFQLYFTAILFSCLNAFVLLKIRLPEEKRALRWAD